MKKIAKILILFILFNNCCMGISSANAAYTKMWWEYLDECNPNDAVDADIVHINSNNVLCISNLDHNGKQESDIEVLYNVKDVCLSPYQDTKVVLMLDGTLYNWGDSVLGYDGPFDEVKIPQAVLNNVVSIDCGYNHVGALTADGLLKVWGYSWFYDYFHNRMNIDDFEVDDVKQFEIDNNSFAILKNDGSLWILGYWSKDKGGYDSKGVYEKLYFIDSDVKQIDLRSGNLAYVKNDGSLWMIGSNYCGEMAQPRALLEYTFSPIKIMNGVEKVSLSVGNTMILKTDGTVYSVGDIVQADVPEYIGDNIIAIDFPYMWKRDGTLLKLVHESDVFRQYYYKYNVIKSPIDVKMPDDIYKPIQVNYNGKNIAFDQQPIIENGRTLVPLRAIFETLGANVQYDDASKCIIATKNDITSVLKIGSDLMYVNGKEIRLDVPIKLVNNRTLVPVRSIAETFGCNVIWNENDSSISVLY